MKAQAYPADKLCNACICWDSDRTEAVTLLVSIHNPSTEIECVCFFWGTS